MTARSTLGSLALILAAVAVAVAFTTSRQTPTPRTPAPRRAVVAAPTPAPPESPIAGAPAVLEGRVLRDRDLRFPLGGHVVTLLRDDAAPRTATTDPWGRFTFDAVAPGVAHEIRVDPADDAQGCLAVRVPSLVLVPGETRDVDDLVLDVPGTLAITVTDARGAPLAGATVDALREEEFYGGSSRDPSVPQKAVATAVTDAAGRATLTVPASDYHTLRVSAPGRSTAMEPRVVCYRRTREPREVQVALHDPGSVAGRVIDTSGVPVPGATVLLRRRPPIVDSYHGTRADGATLWTRVTADADGRFTCGALEPGPTEFMAAAPRAMPQDAGTFAVPHPGDVELRLAPPATLRGRVTDAATGAPLAGATITVKADRPACATHAATDDDGRYAFSGLPSGVELDVWFGLPRGWAVTRSGTRTLGLLPGEERVLDAQTGRTAVVEGTVTLDGAPAHGIDVRVSTLSASGDQILRTSELRTSADGRFIADDVLPGPVIVFAAPPGLDPFETYSRWSRWIDDVRKSATRRASETTDAAAGAVLRRSLTVSRPGPDDPTVDQKMREMAARMAALRGNDEREIVVHGRVRTADGVPLLHAQVQQRWRSGDPVAADGRFEFVWTDFGDGSIELSAVDERHDVARSTVTVPAGENEVEVELVLPALTTLRGRVHCAGAPVAGATVLEQGVRLARTASDGTFEIRVRTGRLYFAVEAPGYVQRDIEEVAAAAGQDIELPLAREEAVAGAVVDETGTGVPGVVVVPSDVEGDLDFFLRRRGLLSRCVTDAAGRFRIAGLPSGALALTVESMDGAATRIARTEVPGLQTGADDVCIVVRPARPLAGRVTDSTGRPLRRARVMLVPAGGAPSASGKSAPLVAETDGTGAFEFTSIEGGAYVASVRPPYDARLVPVAGVRVATGDADLRFVLEPAPAISGVVVNADGSPFRREEVVAVRTAGTAPPKELWPWDLDDYLEPDGSFRIVVPPGCRFRLEFSRGTDDAVLEGGEDVASGASGLRLVAAQKPAIAGRCTDELDVPLAKVEVELRTSKGEQRWFRSREDGSFRFQGFAGWDHAALPPTAHEGDCTLVFRADGRVPQRRTGVRVGAVNLGIVLRPAITVTGRLLAADGTPASNRWKVRALRSSSREDDLWRAQPNVRGEFTMDGLDAGDWAFEAIVETSAGIEKTVPLGTVAAGARDVELRLPR